MEIQGTRLRIQRVISRIYYPLVSILASFIISSIIFTFMGFSSLAAFGGLLSGSVGSLNAWGETLNKAVPVILTGLSYAIANRCGIINLGAEGQVYFGALAAVLVGTNFENLPAAIHLPLTLVVAFLGGAVYGLIPAVMKICFNASELITTIMLNYVALYFVNYMIAGPIKDTSSTSNFAQSKQILAAAQLPRILHGTRLHAGLFVAILALLFYQFFMWHTTQGYEMRVIGLNKTAGMSAGMAINKNILLSMFLAGGFAGLAGACELLGVQLRIMENAFNGLGFDGIAVAMLGNNASAGIFLSGLLFGAIKSGANKMQMRSGLPTATVYMLQGLIILFVVGKKLFEYHRSRSGKAVKRPSKKEAAQ